MRIPIDAKLFPVLIDLSSLVFLDLCKHVCCSSIVYFRAYTLMLSVFLVYVNASAATVLDVSVLTSCLYLGTFLHV